METGVIPQTFIQDLLARVDIVDVVGRYVKLRKAGANLLGLCPFHAEKSPSFTVSPTKQFYHCFGCGAHGSAIGFLMEHAGLSYVDAIHDLAGTLGLAVPQEGPAAPPREPGLVEALDAAARFYKQRLSDSARAVAYLKGRGLSGRTAARFLLGYAPDSWRGLEAAVADYDAPVLVTAGLVVESADEAAQGSGGRRKRYDRFRDRIMFPIRNPRGQVIGFGGRVLERGEPKYLNSPETPVFAKGRELYGLFEARDALRAENCAIVVEGYMDVVMLAEHGIGNALATLGTATTADHVRKLLRVVDRVVFAFDGDAAGRRAAWRALEASLAQLVDTKRVDFLFLPPEHDPDSFVRAHGAEGFAAALAGATPLSGFLMHELAAGADLDTPEGRAAMLARARPLLASMIAPGLQIQLLHAVADRAAVSVAELQRLLDADVAAGAAERERGARAQAGLAGAVDGPADRRRLRADAPAPRDDGMRANRFGRPARPARTAGAPDLERRVRLLAALHPILASEVGAPDFLPAALLDWLATVTAQPDASSLASLVESLRGRHDDAAGALERDVVRDWGGLGELSLAEARAEFTGAIEQLRQRGLKAEIDRLVAAGIGDPAARNRYLQLMAMRRQA